MNKWMNEWMNEWMNKWTNEWMISLLVYECLHMSTIPAFLFKANGLLNYIK